MSVALPGASLVALAGAPPNGPLPEQNLVEWLFSSPFGPGGSGVSFGSTLASPGRHLDGPVAPTKPIFVDARTGAQLSHQRLYADTLRYASGLRHLLGLLPAPVPGSPANTSPVRGSSTSDELTVADRLARRADALAQLSTVRADHARHPRCPALRVRRMIDLTH